MIAVRVADAAAAMQGELAGGNGAEVKLGRVIIDSRTLSSGDCFVAIVGPRDDGHRYLASAVEAGATVLVVERERAGDVAVGNPKDSPVSIIAVDDTTRALQRLAAHVRDQINPTVVAVTGSIGKTTTKSLIHAVLAAEIPTHATPGNYNNRWGLPLTLLGLEPHHRVMVAELGMSAPGEIRELARLARPTIGVITNVAPVHMEFFESLEGVAAAKEELAAELSDGGTLIVNADDPRTAAMAERRAPMIERALTFGLAKSADVRALRASPTATGWALQLALPGGDDIDLQLPLPGPHSLANFLAAAAVAHALGLSAAAIARAVPILTLPVMRGQMHLAPTGALIIDDSYNASPEAMLRALDTLVALPAEQRRIFVAGDMLELGSWAEDAHREVGLHAAQLDIDLLVTVGELARDIGKGARLGGMPTEHIESYATTSAASAALGATVGAGDLVLVKGSRGVRMERISEALLHRPNPDRPSGGTPGIGSGDVSRADTSGGNP